MAVHTELARRAARTGTARLVSSLQIGLALVLLILTFATPFVWFEYYGYASFGIGFAENGTTVLLCVAIALTSLALGYCGFQWGWGPAGPAAARFARMTLVVGCWEWVLVLSAILIMWNRITSYAVYAWQGDYWGVSTAAYALVVGVIVFPIIGVVGMRLTRSVGPPGYRLPSQPPAAVAPAEAGWTPGHRVPASGMPARGVPDPSAPTVATLVGGLPVQVIQTSGAWAQVVCSNGWTGWVDGRLLGSGP
ncbi:MAG: SH3 domain-containing protein [Candidatus Dormibacteria bacterium]|jgi:NADH:ubiquinone oxidoreductase subunit K